MIDKAKVVITVAMSTKNRAIGNQNKLLWHIPEDLKRFKEKTLGHPIIMGRKTFESILAILGKPLPGRQNIVITRNLDYSHEGVLTASSIDEALQIAASCGTSEIHIGGGAEIYAQALPFVDELFVTNVEDSPEADTFFPEFEHDFVIQTSHEPKEHDGLSYQWIDYIRK